MCLKVIIMFDRNEMIDIRIKCQIKLMYDWYE